MHIRVLTWNVWGIGASWRRRFDAIATLLLREVPDVVCLQEVISVAQALYLERTLAYGGYECVHEGHSGLFFNRGGLFTAVRAKGCRILKSPHTPFEAFEVQAPPWHPLALTDRLLQKGYQSVVVEIPAMREKIRVINTHLLGSYNWRPTDEMRCIESQHRQVALAAKASALPVIVCGDFNRTPDAFPRDCFLRTTLEEAFDMDPRAITVDNIGNPNRHGLIATIAGRGRTKPNRKIDYALCPRGTRVFARHVFDRAVAVGDFSGFPSDHSGIELMLRLA